MEISKVTQQYWTPEDLLELETAETVASMYSVARRVIDRMPKPIVEVCGPIASGGLGNIEANLGLFNRTIQELQVQGLHVFDQMPFEIPMQNLKKKLAHPSEILDGFYLPLFESKDISTLYFIPNWQSSVGSNWEHDKGEKLGIKIVYL
jgi:hypothetical protein